MCKMIYAMGIGQYAISNAMWHNVQCVEHDIAFLVDQYAMRIMLRAVCNALQYNAQCVERHIASLDNLTSDGDSRKLLHSVILLQEGSNKYYFIFTQKWAIKTISHVFLHSLSTPPENSEMGLKHIFDNMQTEMQFRIYRKGLNPLSLYNRIIDHLNRVRFTVQKLYFLYNLSSSCNKVI